MRLSREQYYELLKRNPKLSPEYTREAPKLEPSVSHAPLDKKKAKEEDPKRVLVRIISVRKRMLDEDNLCEKYLVDCCRYAGLLLSDAPDKTRIITTQRRCNPKEEEHTEITIYES